MIDLINMKIIVVGDGTVGKSSLTQRFAKGKFTTEYKKTLGVDYLTKRKEIENKEIEFLIWDTAGQEYYDSITKRYYKGSHAAVIVFSVENIESYENVIKWKEKVSCECGRIPIILVMNKIDIEDKKINIKDAEALARELNILFFTSSAKENTNVNTIFDTIAIEVLKNMREEEEKLRLEEKLEYVKVDEEKMYENQMKVKGKGFKIDQKIDDKIKKKKKCC